MLKIVADDKIPFLKDSPLVQMAEVVFLPGGKIDGNSLRDADALITRTRTCCSRTTLEGTRVRFIATATIGFDHIDTVWCAERGIVWRNAPGCNAASVGQYITSLLLNTGRPLRGRTLGIIGVGHVGKEVRKAASALGMKILLNDPPRARTEGPEGFTDLPELLAESDFVTLHVPLEKSGPDATFHMADERFFARMKRDAFFINASRGTVCRNGDLKEALKKKTISGAALDVWEPEPEIDRELLNLLQFGTPHIAGYSTDGKANGTGMSVRALAEFFGIRELKNWTPERVPLPEKTVLDPGPDGAFEEILRRAVNGSYDIREDDARLRQDPSRFEKLRGGYPLRREFPCFEIRGGDRLSDPVRSALAALGFRIRS